MDQQDYRGIISSPYIDQIEAYTRGNLLFQSDILLALSGILNVKDSCFGLPFCEFHRAILWQTKVANTHPEIDKKAIYSQFGPSPQ